MADRSQLDISVLGPVRVAAGSTEIEPGGPKPRLVLALLVARAGSVVAIDRLIDDLWGDDPPATARKSLQVHVSNLRRSLGPDAPIVTERSGYRLERTAVRVDAHDVERDCERARRLPPADASALLASALSRWRGPAYADLRHEDAIRTEAVRLDELRVAAIEQRLDADLSLGRHDVLLGELEALATEHPYRERLRCLHVLALYRSGRQAEALRAYERARRVLAEDVGIEPGAELRQLHQAVLAQSPELDLVPPIPTGTTGRETVSAWTLESSTRSIRGYELREPLGGSPRASVFRAYQPSTGREVALKVISPDLANEPDFVLRFESDCRLLAGLDHPHVLDLHDYWRDPTGAFVVMPLMRGGTLAEALDEGPLATPIALRVIEQVGSALAHAHRQGVAHGDLRPSNVLLDGDGNAYLSDFAPDGRSPGERANDAGEYRSPERRRGAAPLTSTDVWSFAVLACKVLTGAGIEDGAYTRAGLPAGLLADLRRAVDPDPARRFEDVGSIVRACRRALGAEAEPDVRQPTRNPYKGLRAFGESDAADFFGRDELVTDLIERVTAANLTVVVGPSGSGKSSLVRAGVLPRLRRDGLPADRHVLIAEMFPGAYPFDELESALLHVAVDHPEGLIDDLGADDHGIVRAAERLLPDGTDLVLVIDQLEELFTLGHDGDERQRFLRALQSVALDDRSRVRIIATLRADYFDRPLQHAEFGEIVSAATFTVMMPGERSLAAAISEPARRAGLEIEPGLIPTILGDLGDEPGALPLLQYALTELFATRERDELSIASYRRTGGVVGALARRADTVFEGLSPDGRLAAREMFLRMVSVNEESDDTRRRVRLTELRSLDIHPECLEEALEAFGTFRLLTFDHDAVTRGPTIEVAHEALMREWPRLRAWIDGQRDDLRTERRLRAESREWVAAGRDAAYLMGGLRLQRYEEWTAAARVRLTADERSFIQESRLLEDHRARAVARRRRRVTSAVSVLAAVAIVAAVIAIVQRDRADRRAREAAEQTALATDAATTSRELLDAAERRELEDEAGATLDLLADHPDDDLGLLVALELVDELQAAGADITAAMGPLYEAVASHRVGPRLSAETLDVERLPTVVGPLAATSLVSNPAGSILVATPVGHTTATAIDVGTGAPVGSLTDDAQLVASLWDADREVVLTGTNNGRINVWRPDGEEVESYDTGGGIVWPIARNDDAIVYGRLGTSGDATRMIGGELRFSVVIAAWASKIELLETKATNAEATGSPDGRRLLTIGLDGRLHVVDLATLVDDSPAHWPHVVDADWGPDSAMIWTLDGAQLVAIDLTTGAVGPAVPTGLVDAAYVDVSPSGRMAVVGAPGAPARVLALPEGQLIAELVSSTTDELADVEHEPRGRLSVTWLTDRRLAVEYGDPVIWDLADLRAPTAFWPAADIAPVSTHLLPSGMIVLGSEDGGLVVVTPDGDMSHRVEGHGLLADQPVPAVLAANGRLAALPGESSVDVVDLASGEPLGAGPVGYPRPLALTPDGERMLVATAREPESGNHQIALVDVRTGEVLRLVSGSALAETAELTSDGRVALVAVAESRSTMTQPPGLWLVSMDSGAIIRRGPTQRCIVDIAIDHGDRRAATVGCDGAVRLFDLALLATSRPFTAELDVAEDIGATGTGAAFSLQDDRLFVTRPGGQVDAFHVADDVLSPAWSFELGGEVGVPLADGDTLWIPVRRPIDLPGDVGGVIGLPLAANELVAFARTLPTRTLSAEECATYTPRRPCSGS